MNIEYIDSGSSIFWFLDLKSSKINLAKRNIEIILK